MYEHRWVQYNSNSDWIGIRMELEYGIAAIPRIAIPLNSIPATMCQPLATTTSNATTKIIPLHSTYHHLHQAPLLPASSFSMCSMDDWAFTSLMLAWFTRCLFQCLWSCLRKMRSASNRIGVMWTLLVSVVHSGWLWQVPYHLCSNTLLQTNEAYLSQCICRWRDCIKIDAAARINGNV